MTLFRQIKASKSTETLSIVVGITMSMSTSMSTYIAHYRRVSLMLWSAKLRHRS